MSSTSTPAPKPEVSRADAEDRAKRLIAIVIASAAIIGAILALLRTDASSHADEAKRLQKRLTLEASALKLGSQSELGFNLSAAQAWLEMAKLTSAAESQGALALPDWENFNFNSRQWPAEIATVQPSEWYATPRDRLEEVAPILQAPFSGNVRKFYADKSLVSVTSLTEQATDARSQQNQWADKSSSYTFYLAILAIGGALLGLSTTMQRTARRICLVTGVAIALTVVGLSASVYAREMSSFSHDAIEDYAKGVGLAYQGQTIDERLAGDLTRQAVASFDKAIAAAPNYANALFDRANALYRLQDYEAAAESFRRAIDAGRSDTGALWNLGWNEYLLGHFDEANQAYRQALTLNPDLIAVRMNLALALLANGSVDDARSEYESALQRSERLVKDARSGGPQVPYSFWKQIDRSAFDIDALQARINGTEQEWMEAPPKTAIAKDGSVRDGAIALSKRLREANVGLEYEGGLPTSSKAAGTISPFTYTGPGGRGPDTSYPSTPFEAGMVIDLSAKSLIPPAIGSSNTITVTYPAAFDQEVFTYSKDRGIEISFVQVNFDFSNLQDGTAVLWKVYRDGTEDHSLRWQETWQNGDEGHAVKPLQFVFVAAGTYRVEMYYDGRLAQVGEFKIEPRE